MGCILFGLLLQDQAHDSNWEHAGWMSERVNVTGILAGRENSLPKEYFNGFSSAAALTTPLSIPLIFHRLHNNLSLGLKRPITLARLLLAITAPGSLKGLLGHLWGPKGEHMLWGFTFICLLQCPHSYWSARRFLGGLWCFLVDTHWFIHDLGRTSFSFMIANNTTCLKII